MIRDLANVAALVLAAIAIVFGAFVLGEHHGAQTAADDFCQQLGYAGLGGRHEGGAWFCTPKEGR